MHRLDSAYKVLVKKGQHCKTSALHNPHVSISSSASACGCDRKWAPDRLQCIAPRQASRGADLGEHHQVRIFLASQTSHCQQYESCPWDPCMDPSPWKASTGQHTMHIMRYEQSRHCLPLPFPGPLLARGAANPGLCQPLHLAQCVRKSRHSTGGVQGRLPSYRATTGLQVRVYRVACVALWD